MQLAGHRERTLLPSTSLCCCAFTVVATLIAGAATLRAADSVFTRGDINVDQRIDVSDAIAELAYLFGGAALPSCEPVADANADQGIDLTDPLYVLLYLFQNGPGPRPLDALDREICRETAIDLAVEGKPEESLSPTEVTLAGGTGFAGDGVGLFETPGTIEFTIPDSAEVLQVLVYWNGFSSTDDGGDDTLLVDGNEVTGTLIGGPTLFFPSAFSTTYRADITDLGLVSPGANSIMVDAAFSRVSNGASILVVIDDGSEETVLALHDGQDLAFINFAAPLDATVPQTFSFEASTEARTATLTLIAGSVEGPASGGDFRPNVVRVETGSVVTEFFHEFGSTDGPEWDHVVLEIEVPAGATSLTVEAISADPEETGALPASLVWVAAGLAITPQAPPPPEPASIGDTVYCDANNDGVQNEGEEGIPGVTVELRCAGPDETLDTDDDITDSQVTGEDGHYLFSDLSADLCVVSVAVETVPGPCNVTGMCATSMEVDLEPGENFLDADFCFTEEPPPPEPASIGDTVYCDANNDGVQNEGEEGIPGVTVELRCAGPDETLDTDDDITDSQVTGEDGHYLFSDLSADLCVVSVAVETVPGPCNVTGMCATSMEVDLEPGENFLDADFCFTEEPPPPAGDEGCTPGYWKQPQHFGSYPDDVSPDTLFSDVFGTDALGDITLLEALSQGGGGLDALGRHAVAAYLSSRTVSYGLSTGEVIDLVQEVLATTDDAADDEEAKNLLDTLNNAGCPLGRAPVEGGEEEPEAGRRGR